MILIAYDGSDDAQAAVERAAKLFPGQQMVVLSVWQHFVDTMARAGAGLAVVVDFGELDENAEHIATDKANEGVEIAHRCGLEAEAATRVVESTVAAAIISEAADRNADAIVIGTRGLTGIKSIFLGSTSHAVVQHADRPVLVIPSPDAVTARAKHHAAHVESNSHK